MCMKTTTAEATVQELRRIFASFGLRETVVTDNGPQFTSAQFSTFLASNGIRHLTSPPYHPASNGMAERLVQTVKKSLLKQIGEHKKHGMSMQHWVDQFLFSYRNTPCASTGVTPAQLFLTWAPRTRLSLLHPELSNRLKTESREPTFARSRSTWREFTAGDYVRVKGTRPGDPLWLTGTITHRISAVTYSAGE